MNFSMSLVISLVLVFFTVGLVIGDRSEEFETKLETVLRNLELPTFMGDCKTHEDCQDHSVRGALGQYCAQFGQDKCSYKKDGNTWCYEDEECISGRCYISQCTFPHNLQYCLPFGQNKCTYKKDG